jgi:Clip-domain serine protease homolog Scarface
VRKPSNQYLPGFPDRNPAPSNDQPSIIRPQPVPQRPQPVPQRPQPVPQRPIVQPQRPQPIPQQPRPQPQPQRPYQPQPTVNRPVVQYDPAPILIPVGCAAALNCTQIQFCTANGVISKTPVSLTPQQEMFRVPLTDCREPMTQQVGKCCRDPDYTDPWPVGRTGQYVPEELNSVFNSGAYKPEPSANVPVRVRVEQDGYVLPQPSNTQQRLYLPPNRI